MKLRVLGCYGGNVPDHGMTSFLVNDSVCLDAGFVSSALSLREQVKVMIGGAPVTDGFAKQIGADGYSPDAPGAVSSERAPEPLPLGAPEACHVLSSTAPGTPSSPISRRT